MSIVRNELIELLKDTWDLEVDEVRELGGDNFSVTSREPERTAEWIEGQGLEATYDDEEGDIIIHFTGIDDYNASQKKSLKTLKVAARKESIKDLKKRGIL